MTGRIPPIYVILVADFTFFKNMCLHFLIESNELNNQSRSFFICDKIGKLMQVSEVERDYSS